MEKKGKTTTEVVSIFSFNYLFHDKGSIIRQLVDTNLLRVPSPSSPTPHHKKHVPNLHHISAPSQGTTVTCCTPAAFFAIDTSFCSISSCTVVVIVEVVSAHNIHAHVTQIASPSNPSNTSLCIIHHNIALSHTITTRHNPILRANRTIRTMEIPPTTPRK